MKAAPHQVLHLLTLLAAVNELPGVDPLSSDEELRPLLKPVRVTENHFGQGSATARVMDDVLSEFRSKSTLVAQHP